jgi:hypothetical protein
MTYFEGDDKFWELAIATNAAFKGLLGHLGQSGHVCAYTRPVTHHIDLSVGWEGTCEKIAELLCDCQIDNGDIVVIPDKIVAIASNRIGPRHILTDPDPKQVDRDTLHNLAEKYEAELGFKVTPLHLLLADEYGKEHATLGTLDHNTAAWELSSVILSRTDRCVDVVISDTDTGLDVRSPLIGCVTIGATPLGATAGLNLYGAMRCAVAAEFDRGHTREIPVVVCVPSERCRTRKCIGELRYPGSLHISKEPSLTYQ